MSLSDTKVRNAKPTGKDIKLTDGEGMYLKITVAGSKCWRLKYRFGGKEKTLALGMYPDVSLSEAREKRHDARKLLAKGIDPGVLKKLKLLVAETSAENSFEVVARQWHSDFKAGWSVDHADRILHWFEIYIFPWIGGRLLPEIEAPEILALLNRIKSGSLDTAYRVMTNINRVFLYGIATGKCKYNPVAGLRGALPKLKGNNFSAPTDPKKVGPLIKAMDQYDGSIVVKSALQLAPLVFVRPGELRAAEWPELDLDNGEWNIPAEKMKMKVAHLVPLSSQAVAILKELQPITGRGKYVFPSFRTSLRCMSENAVNAALRSMGFDREFITGHGFRATARTILDEILGFRPDIIEHQLAHTVKDPNGRAYNRTAHLVERKRMMQVWADYLDELKTQET